jgi:hypothetical protein
MTLLAHSLHSACTALAQRFHTVCTWFLGLRDRDTDGQQRNMDNHLPEPKSAGPVGLGCARRGRVTRQPNLAAPAPVTYGSIHTSAKQSSSFSAHMELFGSIGYVRFKEGDCRGSSWTS